MSKRREFPRAVRSARLKHAMDAKGVLHCEGCGVMIKHGEYAFDHHNPDGLTGEPTFENCRVLCIAACHPDKTAADQERIARAQRQEALHLGAKAPPTKPIRSKGFPHKPKRQPRPSLTPRKLYAPIEPAKGARS